jgi:hypothetical protein
MRQMTHQNFGAKIYRTDRVLTEKACLENRVGLRRGMANTVLIKMQCTRLTPASAGAVMCTLAHPQRWEKCESPRLGASLKPAKLTVLPAKTLDSRRNCRHIHMLGRCSAIAIYENTGKLVRY